MTKLRIAKIVLLSFLLLLHTYELGYETGWNDARSISIVSRVSRAIEFYRGKGYDYVETPWMVSNNAVYSTLPTGKKPFFCGEDFGLSPKNETALVGSAEQAFVQLMLDGRLPLGSHMAAGPCFRDDEVDELHQKTFFKVELIIVTDYAPPKEFALSMAYNECSLFFFDESVNAERWSVTKREIVKTEIGYDIVMNGIEIGSYGVRSFEGHHWIYGTGLAEPRFSMALAKGGK